MTDARNLQGWTDTIPAKGDAVRVLDCEVPAGCTVRLRSVSYPVEGIIRHSVESATMTQRLWIGPFSQSIAIPAGQVVVEIIPNGSKSTLVHASISASSGIENLALATIATQGPCTSLTRGQELDVSQINASISIKAGYYTLVLEQTGGIWGSIAISTPAIAHISAAAETTSVPIPPFAVFNLYTPVDIDLNCILEKLGTGHLWISRQQ